MICRVGSKPTLMAQDRFGTCLYGLKGAALIKHI